MPRPNIFMPREGLLQLQLTRRAEMERLERQAQQEADQAMDVIVYLLVALGIAITAVLWAAWDSGLFA